MFSDLITSKSRVKVLNVFLANPSEMFHVREIVRRTNDEINAVRRELAFLKKKGILNKRTKSKQSLLFSFKSYPFYYDLLRIGSKNIGLGAEIIKNRVKLGKIKYAMFSGRFLRRIKNEPDEVDLIIVGNVVLPELALLVREEEKRLDTEINYTVMTEEEFDFRKKKRDPFVVAILSGSRVMLLGDEENMLS